MKFNYARNGRTQILMSGDIEQPGVGDDFINILPNRVDLVYSDPPWNPGNATYWRTHAGTTPCASYPAFLDRWCGIVTECILRGAQHVFCEQSTNATHRQFFLDAVNRQPAWTLPLLEEWTVYYGSPGSISVRNPNHLLHYGKKRLRTDPTDMDGEAMTIRVCAGLIFPAGSWIIDPCIGKGMTSRMAHYFDWNCVGLELNPKRLDKTRQWIAARGYKLENEHE